MRTSRQANALVIRGAMTAATMAVMCLTAGCERSWPRPDPSISPRDCLVYNADALRIEQFGGLWIVTDGSDRMMSFDTALDARNGLALARRYGLQCFIGRHPPTHGQRNAIEYRRYIVHYWDEPTDARTTISPEHCIRYSPSRVHARDDGAAGWVVTDDGGLQLIVDTANDANSAVTLARQYTTYCTIGYLGVGKRSSRVDYWR